MPTLTRPDIPLAEIIAAHKQAFRTLLTLAQDLTNPQQARLAALNLLAIPLPEPEAAAPSAPAEIAQAAEVHATGRAARQAITSIDRLLALTQKPSSAVQRLLSRAGSG